MQYLSIIFKGIVLLGSWAYLMAKWMVYLRKNFAFGRVWLFIFSLIVSGLFTAFLLSLWISPDLI